MPRYKLGVRFCRTCEAAFHTVSRFCACCGKALRIKRHHEPIHKNNKKSRLEWKIIYQKRKKYCQHYYARNADRIKANALEYYHRNKNEIGKTKTM